MYRCVGVILVAGLREFGEDGALIDHGAGKRIRLAGVETPALQTGVVQGLDQPCRTFLNGLNYAQEGHDNRHEDIFHQQPDRWRKITRHISARGVAGAHRDETKVGMTTRHRRHP